jgi:predicted NUDIX family NTP pyrophosphohydrolase
MFRRCGAEPEVFLVHPGGPFWARRDLGAWSIPKGEFAPGDDPLAAARREFAEETGIVPEGEFIPLRPCRQTGGKVVYAWAVEGDCDPEGIKSNTFVMEWPPRSGRRQEFPEVDRAAWFPLEVAKQKLISGQAGLVDGLRELLAGAEQTASAPASATPRAAPARGGRRSSTRRRRDARSP